MTNMAQIMQPVTKRDPQTRYTPSDGLKSQDVANYGLGLGYTCLAYGGYGLGLGYVTYW